MRWLSLVVYFKVYFFDMFFKSQKIPKTLMNLLKDDGAATRVRSGVNEAGRSAGGQTNGVSGHIAHDARNNKSYHEEAG